MNADSTQQGLGKHTWLDTPLPPTPATSLPLARSIAKGMFVRTNSTGAHGIHRVSVERSCLSISTVRLRLRMRPRGGGAVGWGADYNREAA